MGITVKVFRENLTLCIRMERRGDDPNDLKLIFVKIRITKEICDEIGLP